MKVVDMWKKQVFISLKRYYKGLIPDEKIMEYVNYKASKARNVTLNLRNLYTNSNFKIQLNDILDIVEKENLCITCTNTLYYSYDVIRSVLTDIILENKVARNVHKNKAKMLDSKLAQLNKEKNYVSSNILSFISNIKTNDMLEVDEKMELLSFVKSVIEEDNKLDPYSPDFIDKLISKISMNQTYEENYQLKIKRFMNALYGVQIREGSFLYNPDTAASITGQGREVISEMTWSIERTLYNTIHFSTFNEFNSYVNSVLNEVNEDDRMWDYITYYPSEEEFRSTFISLFTRIFDYKRYDSERIYAMLYNMIKNLTVKEKAILYYKCNLIKLISKNYKVFNVFFSIINDSSDFLSTSDKHIPEKYKPFLNEICSIVEFFTIPHISTANRVFKYENKRRRAVILSDTDSIMINLNPYVVLLGGLYFKTIGSNEDYQHLIFTNEKLGFKLINIMSYICIYVTKIAGDIFTKNCNTVEKFRKYLNMKNEFLQARMLLYSNAKKNYYMWTRLREGEIIDKTSSTGVKARSSNISPYIKENIMRIVTPILKEKDVKPLTVYKHVVEMKKELIEKIRGGEITLGKRVRYSGENGYKTGVLQNEAGRSCYIWNSLYPEYPINVGDYAYLFKMNLISKESIMEMCNNYPEMKDKVFKTFFDNKKYPDIFKYGLSAIAVPKVNIQFKIPQWILPYIKYEELADMHMQPLISLLPSIGLQNSRIDSTHNTFSPILLF